MQILFKSMDNKYIDFLFLIVKNFVRTSFTETDKDRCLNLSALRPLLLGQIDKSVSRCNLREDDLQLELLETDQWLLDEFWAEIPMLGRSNTVGDFLTIDIVLCLNLWSQKLSSMKQKLSDSGIIYFVLLFFFVFIYLFLQLSSIATIRLI